MPNHDFLKFSTIDLRMSEHLSELEQRVRTGDADALAEYVMAHKPKLMAMLERKVGEGLRRKLELEDIYQEILARAVRDLANIDFKGQDPLGWIYQVMDRQIVDLHRYHFEAQKRDAGREVSANSPAGDGGSEPKGFADLLVASMTTPSAAMSRDLKLMRIYSALETLSDDMKRAIRWKYLDGVSNAEIAERLGKSDVATRVLLSRAIRKLQATLEKPE